VADFELSFGGKPFRYAPARVLAEIARTYPLEAGRDFQEPDPNGIGANTQLGERPVPPPGPEPVLNSLFYPTGAVRWAHFRGLMGTADKDAVLAQATVSSQAQRLPFVMDDATGLGNARISTNLYMLPPRPVIGVDGATDLWLVTLVDERYYWRWAYSDTTTLNWPLKDLGVPSWKPLLDKLKTDLGITLDYTTPAIDAGYLGPAADSPLYGKVNATFALELAAGTIGRVLVRHYDATYKLVRHADATTKAEAARVAVRRDAGGILFKADPNQVDDARAPAVPQAVEVTFPKWIAGGNAGHYYDALNQPDAAGNTWPKHVQSYSYGIGNLPVPYTNLKVSPFTAVVQTTCKAKFSTEPPTGTPTNDSVLAAAAQLIAKDYYDAALAHLDEAYTGTIAFDPEAGCDLVAAWRDTGHLTRVRRGPLNRHLMIAWLSDDAFKLAKFTMLRVQHWGYVNAGLLGPRAADIVYTRRYGFPAKVQKWESDGGLATPYNGRWVDASDTYVAVRDPQGKEFRPTELVRAEFTETTDDGFGAPQSKIDVYTRTGNDSLYVGATTSGYSYPGVLYSSPSVTHLTFGSARSPFYTQVGGAPPGGDVPVAFEQGYVTVGAFPAGQLGSFTNPNGGMPLPIGVPGSFIGLGGLIAGSGQTIAPDPYNYYDAYYQWARFQPTGFSQLFTDTLNLTGTAAFGAATRLVGDGSNFALWTGGSRDPVMSVGGVADGGYLYNTGVQFGGVANGENLGRFRVFASDIYFGGTGLYQSVFNIGGNLRVGGNGLGFGNPNPPILDVAGGHWGVGGSIHTASLDMGPNQCSPNTYAASLHADGEVVLAASRIRIVGNLVVQGGAGYLIGGGQCGEGGTIAGFATSGPSGPVAPRGGGTGRSNPGTPGNFLVGDPDQSDGPGYTESSAIRQRAGGVEILAQTTPDNIPPSTSGQRWVRLSVVAL
jgi:hypothetical protein